MPWGLLVIGIAFGIALLFADAKAPMLIAVGMYIPFDTSSAIALGGLFRLIQDRIVIRRSEEARLRAEDTGSFIASGLIAGEAIMGIVLAVTFLTGIPSFTRLFTGRDELFFVPPIIGYLVLALVMIWPAVRAASRVQLTTQER